MLRSLLIPAILIGLIATPFMLPLNDRANTGRVSGNANRATGTGWQQASQDSIQTGKYQAVQTQSPFHLASSRNSSGNVGAGTSGTIFQTPGHSSTGASAGIRTAQVGYGQVAGGGDWGGPILDENNNVIGMVPGNGGSVDPGMLGMTPDYGSMQTMTLPGNALGPDFSAQPMPFAPVMRLEEIFKFGVTAKWMRQRWSRVSNAPAADGLHGQRVALVTGTNSWDLHGSLTYYFDEYQKCRRITFRGWAGDETKLVQLLQAEYGFKQQPTHWAGFYLARNWRKTTGGLLMKNPTVTYVENKVQQVGLMLELNDPKSKFGISADFDSLIKGSQQN